MFNKLDVGCGDNPQGDVTCDLYRDFSPQIDTYKIRKVNVSKNFVQCDAQHLPFKSSAFEEVYCSHVIEHVRNPFLLLKELLRVAKGTVTIKCPHRFSTYAKLPSHRNYFTMRWFLEQLNGFDVKIEVSHSFFPSDYVRFVRFVFLKLPQEITVKVKKSV